MSSLSSKLLAAGLCVLTVLLAAFVARPPATTTPVPEDAAPPVVDYTIGFRVSPYLQYPTRTSITVMCETAEPTTCVVTYGPVAPGTDVAENPTPSTLHEIKLDKLIPKSRYLYRVTCTTADGRAYVSPDLSFFTAPDPDDAWSFTTIGDTQKNPKMTGQIGGLMWKRRPNFVIHCGDVVDNGPDPREWTDELFGPCRDLFGRIALVPCIGNHEKNHPHYYKYFSLPKPEYHYSFAYGNAEFFSLDTNKKVGPGTEQYQWLDRALGASTAKWKICFHHHPPYSSDNNDYGDTFKTRFAGSGDENARGLVALYEKHKVDIVFTGHVHIYERTWPIKNGKVDQANGVTYVTTGGGGGSLEDFSPTPAFFKAEHRSDYHYCYVTVHQGTLRLKAFDRDDRLFDQFELKK